MIHLHHEELAYKLILDDLAPLEKEKKVKKTTEYKKPLDPFLKTTVYFLKFLRSSQKMKGAF